MVDRSVFFDLAKTRFGTFQVAATERGVASIHFPNRHELFSERQKIPQRTRKILTSAKHFLRDFTSGKMDRHDLVPIDWRFFSDFDRRVLNALRKISPGRTISYSALANRAHVPRAARAVGNALNRNPIPILIPCHRMVRKDQTLGGYAGGMRWKRTLLKLEHQNH